jgi:hypothetical protein
MRLAHFNRYKVLERHTLAFLKGNFNTSDFDISRIDFAFIADYEFYLRSVRKMGNNAVVKHMKMFRKIVNICLGNGWMNLDPYLNFKGKYKNVDKAILTRAELDLMASKEFASDRLAQVRDTFLFCCFTGLAYSDIQKLEKKPDNTRNRRRPVDIQPADKNQCQVAYSAAARSASNY